MSILIALVIGLIVLLLGYLSSYLLKMVYPSLTPTLPEICNTWNDNHVMEWTLFTTGVLTYGAMCITGINCDH